MRRRNTSLLGVVVLIASALARPVHAQDTQLGRDGTKGHGGGVAASPAPFVQGADSSSEVCSATAFCVIQGESTFVKEVVNCDFPDCGATYTWALDSMPAGTHYEFRPRQTQVGETTTVKIWADPDAATQPFEVMQAKLKATPEPPGWPLARAFQVHCSLKMHHCGRLEIIDLIQGGKVVSGAGPEDAQTGKPIKPLR